LAKKRNTELEIVEEKFVKRKRPDRNPASCKIQYPMKNRDKDVGESWIFKTYLKIFFTEGK
jgi:hypothetical protein